MAGNYSSNGQDWYNQRLNQIASMMSMQNTDPSYLAGALIGDILRTPFQNWIDNKVLPSITGGSTNRGTGGNNADTAENAITSAAMEALSPNSGNLLMTKEEMLSNPIQGYQDLASAGQAYNQQMDLARLAQQNQPTQSEVNEAVKNASDQAVMQQAQQQGNMQGIMPGLFQQPNYNGANIIPAIQAAQQGQAQKEAEERNNLNLAMKIMRAYGGSPFDNASSLGSGGDEAYEEIMRSALLKEIFKAKQAYATAQQANDKEGMDNASSAAEAIRQMAKEEGINLSEAGADTTIDELAQTIQKEQDKLLQKENQRERERLNNLSPQELLQQAEINVSPNDFYQRAYEELHNRGIPEYRARQKASDMVMQYEARYINAMQNDFNTQGLNADGSMNAAGIDSIMRMAAANNPQIAQMLMNQYASPRDMWGFNRDIDRAQINEELRERLASYNFNNIDIPRMQYNAELTDRLNANNAARRTHAAVDAMNAQLDQISRLVNVGAISPEEGRTAVMSMLGLGSGKGSSGRSGNSGNNEGYSMTPKEQIALAGNLGYLMNSALIGAQGSDKDKAQEAVDNYMAEKEKYRAQLIANGDTDSIELLDGFGFVLNFIYAALHGDETHAVEYYKAFRNNPDLKAYVSGIDLTKYDRLIEKQIKNEQKKQEQENQDNQYEDENQETYGTATALLRSIT